VKPVRLPPSCTSPAETGAFMHEVDRVHDHSATSRAQPVLPWNRGKVRRLTNLTKAKPIKAAAPVISMKGHIVVAGWHHGR